jgi:hypothetical protein
MDTHGKPILGLVRYSSGEREEKGNCWKKDQGQEQSKDKIAGGRRGR